MSKVYQERAAELVRTHLAELIQRQVSDPRVRMVTVTGVEVTPDTTRAHVYVSVLGEPEEQEEAMQGLRSAAGYLRRELGRRIRLRNTPELVFHLDTSLEHGEHISALLDQLWENGPEEPGPES